MSEVVLVMAPFAYSYSIPYQLGYVKSSLNSYKISSKIFDLNIEFYHEFDLLEDESSSLLDLSNWQLEGKFAKLILPVIDRFIDDHVNKIVNENPQVIGFSLFNTNRNLCAELAKRIKRKRKECRIVFGGVDSTISFNRKSYQFYGDLFKRGFLDAIILGEGDEIFPKLCGDTLPTKIAGVVTKENIKNGSFEMRPFIDDINSIPFPDYSDFELDRYTGNVLPLSFSRGCNYHCTFCEIESLWLSSLRVRSSENIFEEIKKLDKLTNKEFLFFNGAYVNCRDGLLEDLSHRIIDKWGSSPKFRWNGWAKVHKNLTSDVLQLAKRAGCYELVFGVESGSQKVINDMKKGFYIEDAERIICDASNAGIDVTVFIIVGYPTELEEDFKMTLDFISRNKAYIKAAYCMSECILSDKMMSDPEKYGVKKCKHMDAFGWESLNGMTHKDRKERLSRFYKHLKELEIKHS